MGKRGKSVTEATKMVTTIQTSVDPRLWVKNQRRAVRVSRNLQREDASSLAEGDHGKMATEALPAGMSLVPELLRPAGRRYEPSKGTVLHRLWKYGKLTQRQCRAAEKFLEIVEFSREGTSGGFLPGYKMRVDEGRQGFEPSYFQNFYAQELEQIEQGLAYHEVLVLRAIVRDFYWHRHGEKLEPEELGKLCSGYKDNRQAYAAGVSKLQSVLHSLAEYFGH